MYIDFKQGNLVTRVSVVFVSLERDESSALYSRIKGGFAFLCG